jgi:hypothetical protein
MTALTLVVAATRVAELRAVTLLSLVQPPVVAAVAVVSTLVVYLLARALAARLASHTRKDV